MTFFKTARGTQLGCGGLQAEERTQYNCGGPKAVDDFGHSLTVVLPKSVTGRKQRTQGNCGGLRDRNEHSRAVVV